MQEYEARFEVMEEQFDRKIEAMKKKAEARMDQIVERLVKSVSTLQESPGYIRQLENAITKAILMARGHRILPDMLSDLVKSSAVASRQPISDSEVDIASWMETLPCD